MTGPRSDDPAGSSGGETATPATAVFVCAWSAAIVVHRLAFAETLATPIGALSALTAVLAALAPGSARRFAVALVATLAVTLPRLPDVPNHFVFEALVDVGMLVVLAPAVFRGGPPTARVMAIVRPALVALYGWATVHKLNTDFLNPEVSCATRFVDALRAAIWQVPAATLVHASVPWLTLFVEAVIPIGLVVRRLRWIAVLVGGAFHLLLIPYANSGVYSFSAAMFAAYCAFLPPRWTAAVSRVGALSSDTRGSTRARLLVTVACVLAATALAASGHPRWVARVGRASVFVAAAVVWVAVSRAALRFRRDGGPSALPEGAPAAVVLALVVANGSLPYFGVKTEGAFAMFSNLRTEMNGNHLFLPTWNLGFGQGPFVYVESASEPAVAEEITAPGVLVPRYELQRRLAEVDRPVRVTYLDERGVRHVIDEAAGIGLDDPARQVPSWLARKIVRFRPFEPSGPMSCRH